MKKLISILFAAASLATAPLPASALQVAVACSGPDVPEAWLRPGGFCAQANSGNSIAPPQGGGGGTDCVVLESAIGLPVGTRIHVAQSADPCERCPTPTLFDLHKLQTGDRLLLAGVVQPDPCDD